MPMIILIIILLILFGGGGYYGWGPRAGGLGVGTILLIVLILWAMGMLPG